MNIIHGTAYLNDGRKIGHVTDNYVKVIRSESKHTFWKYKAWGFNSKLAEYAIKTNREIRVFSTHKSGETAIYRISPENLKWFIEEYDCVFSHKGEKQYVIPKSFFDQKRENEMVYTPASRILPSAMHTRSVSISGEPGETDRELYT